MKAVVLFRSLSGFTRKYAQWIAEDLGADLFDGRVAKPRIFASHDLIIFCGSLHQGGINGIDIIKRNFAALEGKRIIILVTGGSLARTGIVEEILAANFSDDQQKRLRLFYLRGGFDFAKLDMKNKFLMILRLWRLRKKRSEDLTLDEKDLLAAYVESADATSKEYIRPLIDYARS